MQTIDETTPWPRPRAVLHGAKTQDRTIDVDSSEFQVVDHPSAPSHAWLASGTLLAASLSVMVGTALVLMADEAPAPPTKTVVERGKEAPLAVMGVPAPTPSGEAKARRVTWRKRRRTWRRGSRLLALQPRP